jgi:hypothetical protein
MKASIQASEHLRLNGTESLRIDLTLDTGPHRSSQSPKSTSQGKVCTPIKMVSGRIDAGAMKMATSYPPSRVSRTPQRLFEGKISVNFQKWPSSIARMKHSDGLLVQGPVHSWEAEVGE